MATWPHLYHERVAYLFAAGLYWQRFADVRENPADLCFFAPVRCLVTRREHLGAYSYARGKDRVEDVNQFPAVERRRNPAVPSDQRVKGEIAVFQELGKALTSSLQLDQVLRTIMEKIDEF